MGMKLIKSYVKAKLLGLNTKLFRLFNKSFIYQSKTGYKEINPYFPYNNYTELECKEIPYEQLFLGADFLKDNITLIDTPIVDSPHFELMKVLSTNGNFMETDYVNRMINGSLDERYEIVAFCLDKDFFPSCYKKHISEYENGTDKEVIVYQKNNRYYLHDGKHRAALCALLERNVKCKVITLESAFADFNPKKVEKILKNSKYQQHRKLF